MQAREARVIAIASAHRRGEKGWDWTAISVTITLLQTKIKAKVMMAAIEASLDSLK
jgi:hypothetical protein